MKRLFENIEDIYIKGDISELTSVVKVIDASMQNIADVSDQLAEKLAKYASSNKGLQFERVITTSVTLRDELYQASLELNDMQNQIVAYQNKIYRYEGLSQSAEVPNAYLVNRRAISYDSSEFMFSRTEMNEVCELLKNYRDFVSQHLSRVSDGRNDIGMIWQDTQYNDFSVFIDEVIKKVTDALGIYDDYRVYLENQIKELG